MTDESTPQNESSKMQHDKGYRDVFSNKDSFIHFLTKYIKASWAEKITEDDIERVNASFVMKDYQKRESDVVYKLKNENVFFYILLELQSEPDFTMPFRLLQYMMNLLADEFKNTPENVRELKDYKLPAIVPIVLYNGEDNWTPVRSFKEYTSNYGEFGDNIIDFKYILFDLNRYNEEDILTTHKLLDFVFTMDLKHYSRTIEDFINEYQRLVKLQHELTDDDIKTFVLWITHALLEGKFDENFEKEAVAAFRKGDVETMTYAFNRLVEREKVSAMEIGLNEGRKEGGVEKAIIIANKMLKHNKPIDEIMEYTDLTREEIERLQQ